MEPTSIEHFCDIWLRSGAFRAAFSVEADAPHSFP